VTSSIAGVPVPDTRLVADATDFIKSEESPLLFHHSRRVYLFGMLQGKRRGLSPDPELLYVGAMFHDLGLTEKHRTKDQRFEVDGADRAREFLTAHGIGDEEARRVWTAIALTLRSPSSPPGSRPTFSASATATSTRPTSAP